MNCHRASAQTSGRVSPKGLDSPPLPKVLLTGLALLLGGVTSASDAQDCSMSSEHEWLDPVGWSVRCEAGEVDTIGADACSDSGVGVAAVTREELRLSSEWLKSLCFREPVVGTIRRENRVYEAWISDVETEGALGEYDPEVEKLRVNSSFFFAMGEDEQAMALDIPDTGTMVHELFHAVQENYPSSEAPYWVSEGTADAVMLAWMNRQGTTGMKSRSRYYDDPLHQPRSKLHGYYTSLFWLWLGEAMLATDHISYLAEMLKQGGFEQDNGLSDLEGWLNGEGNRSLNRLFPRFIAEKAGHKVMFDNGERSTRIAYEEPEAVEKYRGTVEPVAADPVTVKVSIPSGKSADLEISIRPDNPDLHLIVDDQVFADPALLPDGQAELLPQFRDPYWKKQRNRFTTSIDGNGEDREFFVRVANVADDPVKSVRQNYTLEIKLKPILGCRFSATIQGDSNKGTAAGEIAHFSTRGGTTIAGAFSNPEQMDQMMQMMEAFGAMGGEEAQQENAEALEKMRNEAEAWKQQMAAGPQETLGLSLIEMQAGDMTDAEAIGVMTGGFKLQASVFDQPVEPGFSGGLNPGHIIVWPGDWTETVSQQIRYEWKPGAPGSGQITINEFSEDRLSGTINATVYGQGVYKESTGEAPQITISARFQAARHDGPLQGGFGCLLP